MCIKIYLDTSVIGYLRAVDLPERMRDTLEFWEVLKTGKYEVYISDVVIIELSRCPEPKKSELLAYLDIIQYTEIKSFNNPDIMHITEEIKAINIIPVKYEDDHAHIAVAIYTGCSILVSWNFKHMVNVKTRNGVRRICRINNTTPVEIYTPTIFLERKELL